MEVKVVGKIDLSERDLERKRFRQRYDEEIKISTHVVQHCIKQWDENEAIMNLTSRIKQLEVDNAKLTSFVDELEHEMSVSIIHSLKDKLKISNRLNEVLRSILRRYMTKRDIKDELSKFHKGEALADGFADMESETWT